jgi:hypothetical protein
MEKNQCLLIGPMGPQYLPDLEWLAEKVVKPIVAPRGLTVTTPSFPETGNIMYQVIRACDRAPLVVANLSGNNPNVLYEIAVLDAMGRACVPVKIGKEDDVANDKVPFDRAAYRCFAIPRDTAVAIAALTRPIEDALDRREKGWPFQNPLTDYFGVPLSSFSSAHGLARGYMRNLVKPTVDGIMNDGYQRQEGDTRDVSFLTLEIVIPSDFDYATREKVRSLLHENRIHREKLNAPGRVVEVYSWVDEGPVRLMDIPTTMGALRETAIARLGRGVTVDMAPEEFRALQDDEIAQFDRALRGMRSADNNPDIRERVKVLPWSETPLAKL